MRISGNEPSSVILGKTDKFKSWKRLSERAKNKMKPKGMV